MIQFYVFNGNEVKWLDITFLFDRIFYFSVTYTLKNSIKYKYALFFFASIYKKKVI